MLFLHQVQIRVGRCFPRCCSVFAVQVLLLLWLHHTPDGGTSCVFVTAVPARGHIWGPNSSYRVYNPHFVVTHTARRQRGQYWTTSAPKWMFPLGRHPWLHFHNCRWVPTKAGKSRIPLGSSKPFDQLPQEVTHTQRCSPDGKPGQSWLGEILIPTLSCQHNPFDSSTPRDPHTGMSILSLSHHPSTVTVTGVPWVTSLINFGVQHSALGLCIRTVPGQTRGRSFFLLGR